MNRSVWYGFAAYAIWGTFPLYWVLIRHVPVMQVMAHRVVWSCLVLAGLVMLRRQASRLPTVRGRIAAIYGAAGVLIGVNWTIYVWAVISGYVVETSLGYFITPLVNVLLGVVVFRERLRGLQWAAVALAAAGVLYLTVLYGSPPWIALGLAASFGTYGLIKKQAPLGPIDGLLLETAVLALPGLLFLALLQAGTIDGAGLAGPAVFLRDARTDALLIGTGFLTVGPLLLFASAVRRVPLSVMGILQFIAPSMQFLLGLFVFREPFSAAQFTGFAIVWAAIAIFAVDGVRARRRDRPAPVLDEGAA